MTATRLLIASDAASCFSAPHSAMLYRQMGRVDATTRRTAAAETPRMAAAAGRHLQ